jgi:hypothetical protein
MNSQSCHKMRSFQRKDDVKDTINMLIQLQTYAFTRRHLSNLRESKGNADKYHRRLQGGERHPWSSSAPAPTEDDKTFFSNTMHLSLYSPKWGNHPCCSHRCHRNTLWSLPKCHGPPMTHMSESAPIFHFQQGRVSVTTMIFHLLCG